MFTVDKLTKVSRLSGLSQGEDDPSTGDVVKQEIKESALKAAVNFIGGLFSFGPKTIGYLQQDEVDRIVTHSKVFRYGFMSPGCGTQVPLSPCAGSFWSAAPYRAEEENFFTTTFPWDLRERPAMGDWFYKRFGYRWTLLEAGLDHQPGWFYFDPVKMIPYIGRPQKVGGKLYEEEGRAPTLDEMMQSEVDLGRAATKEEALAKFRENILKNWLHRDNPGNTIDTVINDGTGEVINAGTGEIVLPNFIDTAAGLGGVNGMLLLGLGALVFFKSMRNVR